MSEDNGPPDGPPDSADWDWVSDPNDAGLC